MKTTKKKATLIRMACLNGHVSVVTGIFRGPKKVPLAGGKVIRNAVEIEITEDSDVYRAGQTMMAPATATFTDLATGAILHEPKSRLIKVLYPSGASFNVTGKFFGMREEAETVAIEVTKGGYIAGNYTPPGLHCRR